MTVNVDNSDFVLKTNVAEIKTRVDNIDAEKISIIDELQGKNFVEDSYLYFEPEYRYFEVTKTDGVLSWKSTGLSDEKIKSPKDDYSVLREKKIYLLFSLYSVLGQEKVTYTHGSIANLYVVYQTGNVYYSPSSYDHINGFLFVAGNYYHCRAMLLLFGEIIIFIKSLAKMLEIY